MPDQSTRTVQEGEAGRTAWSTVAVLIVAALILTACAAGSNTAMDVPDTAGDVAGFWLGLWHGIIAPITFIISLFSDTVGVYEVHNNGAWYDFGFLFGASMALGGSGAGARSRR